MPNIVVVGVPHVTDAMIDRISSVIASQEGVSLSDTVITHSENSHCVTATPQHRDEPYLIVRDTDIGQAKRLANALNSAFNVDVEFERLDGFLPRNRTADEGPLFRGAFGKPV